MAIASPPPYTDGADDIPEPAVPAEALAPPPGDPLAEVKAELRGMYRAIDATLNGVTPFLASQCATLGDRLTAHLDQLSPAEAGALQHLCEGIASLTQGLTVHGAPYSTTVQARSPAGYLVSLSIQRRDGAEFLDSLAKMEAWLSQQGYQAI